MRRKSSANVLMFFLIAAIVAVAATGMVRSAKNADKNDSGETEFQEDSFSLTPLSEDPRQYSLVISSADERSISGTFSVDQLQVLRTIMVEAEKFAMTGEAAGTKEPITTRFADKHEAAFVVDVQKEANQSRLFLTLKTEIGRMTWEAGKIIRSTRREEGFFFALLSRLESALPKLPSQPSK